jgi:hypothetical protein
MRLVTEPTDARHRPLERRSVTLDAPSSTHGSATSCPAPDRRSPPNASAPPPASPTRSSSCSGRAPLGVPQPPPGEERSQRLRHRREWRILQALEGTPCHPAACCCAPISPVLEAAVHDHGPRRRLHPGVRDPDRSSPTTRCASAWDGPAEGCALLSRGRLGRRGSRASASRRASSNVRCRGGWPSSRRYQMRPLDGIDFLTWRANRPRWARPGIIHSDYSRST